MWRYIFGFVGFFVTSSVWAFGPCDRDIETLCGASSCPEETSETCLHSQVQAIQDVDCKAYVKKTAAGWQKKVASFAKVRGNCQSELDKYCGEVECKDQAYKAVQVCLMSHKEYLSSTCKSDINRHIEEFQPSVRQLD